MATYLNYFEEAVAQAKKDGTYGYATPEDRARSKKNHEEAMKRPPGYRPNEILPKYPIMREPKIR